MSKASTSRSPGIRNDAVHSNKAAKTTTAETVDVAAARAGPSAAAVQANLSKALTASAPSGARKRVFTTRLGSFRERVFQITIDGWATVYAWSAAVTSGNGG